MSDLPRPRVLYVPPPSHTEKVFRPEVYADLAARYDLRATESERRVTPEDVEAAAPACDAIITGWGSPAFSDAALQRAGAHAVGDRLRLVAHSAGSVKHLFTAGQVRDQLLPRGIVVFSANRAIAYNVAEATIGYLIAFSRGWFEQAERIRRTEQWASPGGEKSGQFLSGATVGLVSASTVGREVIRLLEPFDVRILVYDPYLSDEQAQALGVIRRDLDDLFRESDFVSLHAPSLPATRQMIGARQLGLLRDGALLINTSRGSVLDHDALFAAAQSGRFRVVLDVTTPEPLPGDHPLRRLDNIYLTPHVSGAGSYGYLMIGDLTAAALDDCFAGRPVTGAVDLARWEEIA